MGDFIWNEWSRFVSIAASIYLVWAGYWSIFYRKFFWDFVGGTLRDPGGIQPGSNARVFIDIIVKAPVLQIFLMLVAMATLIIELPAPFIKGTAVQRSWVVRIILLLLQSFLGFFIYQATNGSIYSLIAAFGYIRAEVKGEIPPDVLKAKGERMETA